MSIRSVVLCGLVAGVICACHEAALAQTISVNPVADAFVVSNTPDGNFGGGGAVGVSGLPANSQQAVFRFDLSSAKSNFDAAFGAGNWNLSSAVLQLAGTTANNPIFNPVAAGQLTASWMQNDNWVEGTGTPAAAGTTGITFNSLPSFLSANDQSLGSFGFDGSTSATAMYSLTMTSGLVGDAALGGMASIRLSAGAGDATVSGVFNSRAFGTESRRPLLTLNAVAVPEPASCALAACGLLGLATRARRIRSRAGDA